MMRLHKSLMLLGCTALTVGLAAAGQSSAPDEVGQLQQDIAATEGREQDIKEENAELQARMQELEARIMELRQGLNQDETGTQATQQPDLHQPDK